jgi:hypothetical protein
MIFPAILTTRTNRSVARRPEGWAEKKPITHPIRSTMMPDQSRSIWKGVEKLSGGANVDPLALRKVLLSGILLLANHGWEELTG